MEAQLSRESLACRANGDTTSLSCFPGQIKWCPKKATFPGGCGNNGSQQCLVDFLSNYGASSMPKNCVCKNAGSQRLCSCDVVCQ
uniref:Uncharacterized protein n=1 Tax=Salix viminalis TaxID=40686 RepID=A0A6N2MJT1_SALVM